MNKREILEQHLTEGCGKYQYSSEEEAKRELRKIRNAGQQSNNHRLPIRAYKCNRCPFWHLTSKK